MTLDRSWNQLAEDSKKVSGNQPKGKAQKKRVVQHSRGFIHVQTKVNGMMPFTHITGIGNLTLFLMSLIMASRRCATNMTSRSQRKRLMTSGPYFKYHGNVREISKKVVTFTQHAREFEFPWKVL